LSQSELKPEEKVNLAIGMTDACVRICADAVRDLNPDLKEEELMERIRERIGFGKRRQRGARDWRLVVEHSAEWCRIFAPD